MITGQNVVGNPYAPETIDPQVVKIAKMLPITLCRNLMK